MRQMKARPCTNPRPFPLAPEVCDSCGHMLQSHPQPPHGDLANQAAQRALWKVMVELGGPYSYYGGRANSEDQAPETKELREHMRACAVDLGESSSPRMTQERCFAGTFDDHEGITVLLSASLVCTCRTYLHVRIAVNDLTFSQLLWLALDSC